MANGAPKLDAEYLKQVESARNALTQITNANRCAPVMLRLAFHDAGTYDKNTKKGGANGTLRFELNNPANNGIKFAADLCEQVKQAHPRVSYADIYQLAGVIAVEVTGGPKINFVPGRVDAQQQDEGALPAPFGDASHLREVFYRLSLNDRDIVVLSGSHTLGRAKQENSGFDGPFTSNPLTFDNSYFVELRKNPHTPGLVKFPTDKALQEDEAFRKYVQLYAKNNDAFLQHYAESHKKMSELGFRVF